MNIENCYVIGLNVDDGKAVSSGIGGLVGYAINTNSIKNCYTEGKIISDNVNVGGILGNNLNIVDLETVIRSSISTTNINVGGIIGSYSGTDITTITNNLSISNIYTSSGINSLNRMLE